MVPVLLALLWVAGTAHAADYKMLLCAGNNGSDSYQTATNTASAQNPGGIFNIENYCGPAPDPAGNTAFLRIYENQASGYAGDGAYGSVSWTVPPWIAILAGGGYTREPGSFNPGWRGRFWAEDFGGEGHHILLQGSDVENGSNGGIGAGTTSTFASHLWPFGAFGYYRRFIFELTCMRPGGCDRSGWNGVDANTINLTLADVSPPQLQLTNTGAPFMGGAWVKGTQAATYSWTEQGSGIRMEWVNIDGARQWTIDHASECDTGWSAASGEFAREFQPCATGSNIGRSDTIDTATLPDGAHTLEACAQDYAQFQGLYGSGGASCQRTTIRTDNTPPGAPANLTVTSANPHRYLSHFGAQLTLPPNSGSPIVGLHYYVTNAKGETVVPERFVAATEPTGVPGLEGPARAGAYTLHVALQDQVGFVGAWATAPIPHDTTPPAAPQSLHVIGATTRRVPKLDVQWSNIVDEGSPIDAAHYQVIDASGNVIEATKTVTGDNVERIAGIETPAQRGDYRVRVWLEDGEGNVGAASVVAVPRDTTPPAAPQGLHVLGTTAHRVAMFDVVWSNIVDEGSPIDTAHYRLLDASGNAVGATETATGDNIQKIAGIQTPAQPGDYRVQVWLEDEEGNVGAAATVAVPRDTTPPAAPQGLHVIGTTAHRVASFDVAWSNVVDEGSPIDAAHYQVIDAAGNVVTATKTASGDNIEKIAGIETPPQRGDYRVRVWLEDGEGNVGAASVVAVPRDTTPPAAPQLVSVAAPSTSRAVQSVDVKWSNITDEGSPIVAAHYRVLDASGHEVVGETTVAGQNIEGIADLETPRQPGAYTLVLWLSDEEGNVGAPVRVPLSYECMRSEQGGGTALSAGLGEHQRSQLLVGQDEGAVLAGRLSGPGGGVANAPLCVFSRVATEGERRFLGLAITGPEGRYEFGLGKGPSRELSVAYRPGQREVSAAASLRVRVRPSFRLKSRVVRNGHFAVFRGAIPGPDNAEVVVVLQVRSGKGWRVFRRYRTRAGGRYVMRYRFTRTRRAAVYVMRAQVRAQAGYPYQQGSSRRLRLTVIP